MQLQRTWVWLLWNPCLEAISPVQYHLEVQEIWNEAAVKRTPAEWALRWIWNHPEVTVILSGMNQESHIEENLILADKTYPNSLTEAEIQLVSRVEQKYRQFRKISCTSCRYCMPCPSKVSISECFETYNNLYMLGNVDMAKFTYAVWMSRMLSDTEPGFASQCIKCGECMEKCPQNLKILDLLEAVVEELEGPELQQRVTMIKQQMHKKL